MEINLERIFIDVFAIALAKRKIKAGEELSEEEKNAILQHIYTSAKIEIKDGKELTDVKARVVFKTLSIVTKLIGERGKGYNKACAVMSTSTKSNVDNYRKVLRGVSITSSNQEMSNFQTLIAQYEASGRYGKLMMEFIEAFMAVQDSYKKDYASPIGVELAEQLKEQREEILDLDKKYIRK